MTSEFDSIGIRATAVPGTVIFPDDGFGVLRPFDKREAMTTKEAADRAGITPRQMRRWVDRFGIGRKVAGDLRISRVALLMLLDDDGRALAKYRDGDRGYYVLPYFSRLGLLDLIAAKSNGDIPDILPPCESEAAL